MKTRFLAIGLIIITWVMGNTLGAKAQVQPVSGQSAADPGAVFQDPLQMNTTTPPSAATPAAPTPSAVAEAVGTLVPSAAGTANAVGDAATMAGIKMPTGLAGILSFITTAQGYLTPLTKTLPMNTAISEVLKNSTYGSNPAVQGAATVIASNGQMTGNTAAFGNLLIMAMKAAKARSGATASAEVQDNINKASIYGVNTQAHAGSQNTAAMITENSPFFTAGSDPNTVYLSNLDASTHTAQIVARQGIQLNNISAQNTLTQTTLMAGVEGQQQDRQRATALQAQQDNKNSVIDNSRKLAASIVNPP
jgi:hypothetical protein